MPGLVGLISKMPAERAAVELSRMVASMCHEPFYRSGTWSDERFGVYVGWVERDEPGRTEMPLVSETADKVLVFWGEDFSEQGTPGAIVERGHGA